MGAALKKVRYCILFRPIIKMSEINKKLNNRGFSF